jgi:hypothetical protein
MYIIKSYHKKYWRHIQTWIQKDSKSTFQNFLMPEQNVNKIHWTEYTQYNINVFPLERGHYDSFPYFNPSSDVTGLELVWYTQYQYIRPFLIFRYWEKPVKSQTFHHLRDKIICFFRLKSTHHLGMNYSVNFLGRLGCNGFQLI